MSKSKIYLICTLVLLCFIGFLISVRKPHTPSVFDTQLPAHAVQEIEKRAAKCDTTAYLGYRTERVIGVSIAGIISLDDPRVAETLEDLRVRWVRFEIPWSEVQAADGTYSWDTIDSFVKALAERNIRAAVSLNYVPRWIGSWETAAKSYEAFSQSVVERYKPGGVFAKSNGWRSYGITHWEILNEPNLPGYGWGHHEVDAATFVEEYASLLVSAHHGIRSADRAAVILLGGLSPDGMPPKEFLSSLYNIEGIKDCFDILPFHPYGRSGRFLETAHELKAHMTSLKDQNRVLWFNEFGTSNDAERDQLLKKTFSEISVVPGFFWFSLQDLGRAGGKTYGVIGLDFSRKEGYETLKELLR